MNKIYQIPTTVTIDLQVKTAFLVSVSDGTTITDDNKDDFEYVKENRSNYNVWDDDWSK